MVWSRALTEGRQQGTPPLAYGGVLYMPNPADVIQAIDAVTGDLVWEHRREVPDDIGDYVFNTLWENNRNIAIYGSTILDTSADDHIFALDARTGRLVWEAQVLDYRTHPATQSSGPIVADGKVVSGRSCMPAGRAGRVRHHRPRPRHRRGALGGGAPSPRRASPATRPGAGCRSRSAGTSGRGWSRATTPR